MFGVLIALLGLSFVISWATTLALRSICVRIGFVDKPGGRKIHGHPKPLGGGIAIFLGFAIPMLGALTIVHYLPPPADRPDVPWHAYWSGISEQSGMALVILLAALVLHVMGLLDDRKALGPYIKLIVQLGVTALLVVGMNLRILTFLDRWLGLGPTPSVIVSVLWIVAITNAFNFLDNMDGLSAGVAAVCAAAFFIATLSIGAWFVAAAIALLLGATLGFLYFNFPPASIFMGDAGSLVIGFLLGVLSVRATYLPPGVKLENAWWSIFAPVIVLALPLYDLVVVSVIRLARGKSPFVGDTNHFSHRLVARGMSRRTAVLCLYLVAAATSAAAIVLPHVRSSFAAIMIFAQTLLILGVVALLEQHPLPPSQ
jgi:UDP-GlcNAc:undecaprenyl-phosphate/decaprenyl-phosphate GlcNAc-1-phosphate transferase